MIAFWIRIGEDGKRIGRPPLPRAVQLWSKIERRNLDECWPWKNSLTIYGYGRFAMRWNGRRQDMNAHRAVWLLKYGEIDAGLEVAHECDNRLCCNPKHMFLTTREGNRLDKMMKGRQTRGEDSGSVKLTEEQVRQIRKDYKWYSHSHGAIALGHKYGVHRKQILNIIHGRSWGWLDS